MYFPSTIRRTSDGRWSVRHESDGIGSLEITAATREQATEKLRQEIRYRLELCPCSGETYQHIDIQIVENVYNSIATERETSSAQGRPTL